MFCSPKRANNIRKLFKLAKAGDVRTYVIRRKFDTKNGKKQDKPPKVQRLVTPLTLQHKRQRAGDKRKARKLTKREAQEYQRIYQQCMQEKKEVRLSEIKKRRSSRKSESE